MRLSSFAADRGPVRALNVSVAAGVMLFEVVRQRRSTATQINTVKHR